ncbi:MAG: 50S ribosomal protein L11 methyltransferase [Chlamydiota bacterium]
MNYYLFRLIEESSSDEAEDELERLGLHNIFVIEDGQTGDILLGGHSKKQLSLQKMNHSLLVEQKKNASADWDQQWELFSADFKEGKAHIDLTPFGGAKILLLTPGAGFGDLSHPTTYLMLEMMQGRMTNETIIDIGTGSGILGLAALLLGAKFAYGVDIDKAALEHAKSNAELNCLEKQIAFSKKVPKKLLSQSIFLMNMIFPEQQEISPSKLNPYAKLWIISGILAEQKEEYLKLANDWGWEIVSEHTQGEWMGWVFSV